MLGEISDFKTLEEIRGQFSKKGTVYWDEVIDTLIRKDILIVKNSNLDKKERSLEMWKWNHTARYYHFATRDVKYSFDPVEEKKLFTELAKIEPLPNHYKDYENHFLKLSSNKETLHTESSESVSSLLLRRRTIRKFDSKSISFDQFSRILLLTWGKTASVEEGLIERRVIKTSPSGGCRHPIEVYPIVNNVERIPAGIYHYSVRKHGLELIRRGSFSNDVTKYCSGQPWFERAAAIFVMTAILERSMWRYRNSRTYRIIQLDAGHLAQTFHLVATALHLGPLTTAGIQDTLLENALGIDGINEIAIYVCAVGVPAKDIYETKPNHFHSYE
jgi:SagB-type dehydrogenase family enzyme